MSAFSTEPGRYGDAKFEVVATAAHDKSLALAEIDCQAIEYLSPGEELVRAQKQELPSDLETRKGNE